MNGNMGGTEGGRRPDLSVVPLMTQLIPSECLAGPGRSPFRGRRPPGRTIRGNDKRRGLELRGRTRRGAASGAQAQAAREEEGSGV